MLPALVIWSDPAGGGSSSGRTTDSDSVNLGSNPSPPANIQARFVRALLFLNYLKIRCRRSVSAFGGDFQNRRKYIHVGCPKTSVFLRLLKISPNTDTARFLC